MSRLYPVFLRCVWGGKKNTKYCRISKIHRFLKNTFDFSLVSVCRMFDKWILRDHPLTELRPAADCARIHDIDLQLPEDCWPWSTNFNKLDTNQFSPIDHKKKQPSRQGGKALVLDGIAPQAQPRQATALRIAQGRGQTLSSGGTHAAAAEFQTPQGDAWEVRSLTANFPVF